MSIKNNPVIQRETFNVASKQKSDEIKNIALQMLVHYIKNNPSKAH